ncbi:ANTAR domain-containing protein [Saccharothrix yanglingensis]|uniref:ANTAR domain-containing protein n=1 Tax=Saccharothrix yanglingensis TaxID=659496 RepID=A0ABU0X3R8_9PSEU|nr:ANTAR domain-containing protein [Saccharothrix yanglingensis]MDQ2585229.1 hypothetical protein [Saccharothrix yanglingensis]
MTAGHTLDDIGADPVFRATAAPYLILDPDLRIRAANPAYQKATLTTEVDLRGVHLFDAFPDDPGNPHADGQVNLGASLQRVLSRAQPHHMGIQRYDVPHPEDRTRFVKRAWSPLNTPILDDRRVVGIIHHVEDITDLCTALEPDTPDLRRWQDPRRLGELTAVLSRLRRDHHAVVTENRQLHQALHRRGVIEQAKGILVGTRLCTPDQAFTILVRLSQDTNTKLYDVAQALIDDTLGRRRPPTPGPRRRDEHVPARPPDDPAADD